MEERLCFADGSLDGYTDDIDVIVRFVILLVDFGEGHLLNDLHSLLDTGEDGVLIIQPWSRNHRNEKLTPICARA